MVAVMMGEEAYVSLSENITGWNEFHKVTKINQVLK